MSTQTPALPNDCIEMNPTPQSVYLDGVCINQAALSRVTKMDQGYLSKILSGKHIPGLFAAQKIADALGWTLDRFALALKARQAELQGNFSSEALGHLNPPLVLPKALQRLLKKSNVS